MEEVKVKKESRFVDNVAYRTRFQFRIYVNEYVICQRYFKINGFNAESVHTAEFADCMEGIVRSFQEDLESKTRIFMWYTDMGLPFKLSGYATDAEIEKYGGGFLVDLNKNTDTVEFIAPDGKMFEREYVDYGPLNRSTFAEAESPAVGEFMFKFAFMIDDKSVYEKVWDGGVYPKFVRNGVDMANSRANREPKGDEVNKFTSFLVYFMQRGKSNLINEFIRRVCDTMSNTFSDKYGYTKEMDVYGTNYNIPNREAAIAMYGEIKPNVTGHIDIKEETKEYTYLTPYDNAVASWKKACAKKTREYLDTMYPSPRQIEFIEKNY